MLLVSVPVPDTRCCAMVLSLYFADAETRLVFGALKQGGNTAP